MSSIISSMGTLASTLVHNKSMQSPEIQAASVTIGCLRLAKHSLSDPDPSNNQSSVKKVASKVIGVTCRIAEVIGCCAIAIELGAKVEALFREVPVSLGGVDPYESAFKRAFEKRISKTGIEVLYLVGSSTADPDGAFDPIGQRGRFLYEIIAERTLAMCLHQTTDLTYKVIEHPLQMCKEIALASSKNPVQELVLGMHGFRHEMVFNIPFSSFRVFDWLPSNCFDGLSRNARIFLQSCSTGGRSFWKPNMAEWMSWLSGREVVAPSSELSNTCRCLINSTNNQLDIKLTYSPPNEWGATDITEHFHVSASWMETASFHMKFTLSTILGIISCWQAVRAGATLVQGSGMVVECLVDKSAAPITKVAKKVGLYHQPIAQTLYTVTKQTGKILNVVGSGTHQGMDTLLQPVGQLGGWALKKSVSVITGGAQRLYRGAIDSASDFIMAGLDPYSVNSL
jgi:hypothetical protein